MRGKSSIHSSSDYLIARLTALWALAESGLGGYMHAMKIPFTGIVLGGTAIVVISLIAWFSTTPFKSIIRATLLVLLVVRDFLLDEARSFYGLKQVETLHDLKAWIKK